MEEKYVQKWLLFKIFKYFNVKSMIDYDYIWKVEPTLMYIKPLSTLKICNFQLKSYFLVFVFVKYI